MISKQSLFHFKLLLDFSQVFQKYGISFLPYTFDPNKITVKLIPNLNYWHIGRVLNVFSLLTNIIIIGLGLLIFTELDILYGVLGTWSLTTLLLCLVWQIHLQNNYRELIDWVNALLVLEKNLSKLLIKT